MKQIPAILSCLCVTLFFISGCQKESITQSGMAEDHFFLKSGNQHMPVTVGGNVDSKKFLIIIHGGPGGNAIVYRENFVKNEVEKEMAIVYWDQRFSGNSQGNNGGTDIKDFRKDIKSLLLLLKAKYGSDKQFYLLGHSWGGFLAPYFLVDNANQDLVKGWIQVGGAHNYRLNDSLTREMLLHYGKIEIANGRNTSEWEKIVNWCNNNGFEGNKNAGELNAFAYKAEEMIGEVIKPESGNDVREMQQAIFLAQWSNGISTNIRKIDDPTYANPNSDQLKKIKIPTLLMWGKYDFVVPPDLALDVEANSGSLDVTKIIYLYSGHSPMSNERVKFWKDLINWVKIH